MYAHSPAQLAQMAKRRHASLARFGGAATGIGGLVTAIPDLAAAAWIQSRLVFFIAAAYGYDPYDPMRPAELLVIRGLYPDPQTARRALDGVGTMVVAAYVGSSLERDEALATRLARFVGRRLTRRIDFGQDRSLGPGKIRLLEAIRKTGSISQAGRELGMSYRRAWLLIDDMNHCFREPVVTAQPGGTRGGGAMLTAFGRKLVRTYRAIETEATAATETRLRDLAGSVRSKQPPSAKVTSMSIRLGTGEVTLADP